jgi:hypothetical protein
LTNYKRKVADEMFDLASIFKNEDIKKKLDEHAKNEIMKWIDEKAIPTAEDTLKSISEELKEQSKNESGWKKIRDAFFIPLVFSIILWAFKQSTNLIVAETSASPKE